MLRLIGYWDDADTVVKGSPAALHREAELRRYLFYGAPGELLAIDVED
ncbi:hypothetical protein [Actinoplanes flavus]|uniref:Uncharacterized protein n=1 Tax=Actinoplanes flavus TaxID=2820290 RepID=A0ABS3UIK2_9ACTN|nr:hypothetical protein [Actinoplanes flavus]MBO3738608.1 hypothetical protein [Actinoplanes flavus]